MTNAATVTISREQNKMVRKQLEDHTFAIKNWIASAVEAGEFERAKELVKELRAYQEMFHTFIPDESWERRHG
jgi:hypothetical protein